MDLKNLTEEVCRVAHEAGAYLKVEQHRLRADQVERKHAHDYVSYVDKTSEEMIVARLRTLLPEAGFLTEEGTTGERQGEAVWWVIDPLDGTTNYVHGTGPFAVSIALRNACEILLGVVYEVTLNECFSAWKGGGAWLNGQPIHVSDKPISEALLGVGFEVQDSSVQCGRNAVNISQVCHVPNLHVVVCSVEGVFGQTVHAVALHVAERQRFVSQNERTCRSHLYVVQESQRSVGGTGEVDSQTLLLAGGGIERELFISVGSLGVEIVGGDTVSNQRYGLIIK